MQRGNKPQVPWGFPLELLRFFNMGNQCRQREMNLKAIEARKARMSMMIYIYNIYISIYRQIVTQRERESDPEHTRCYSCLQYSCNFIPWQWSMAHRKCIANAMNACGFLFLRPCYLQNYSYSVYHIL